MYDLISNFLFWCVLPWYIHKYFKYVFVGQEPGDQVIDGMMNEAPGPLNFTMFLTLFGEKLTGNSFAV